MCQESGEAWLGASGSGIVTKGQSGLQSSQVSTGKGCTSKLLQVVVGSSDPSRAVALKASVLSQEMVAEVKQEPLNRAVYTTQQLVFFRASKWGSKRGQARQRPVFHNLMLEVASPYFCRTLFIISRSLDPAFTWEERRSHKQEPGVSGSHPWGCLSQYY